jgi:hypothetical protein
MTEGAADALPGVWVEVAGGGLVSEARSPRVTASTPIRTAITANASSASPAVRVRLLDPVPLGVFIR